MRSKKAFTLLEVLLSLLILFTMGLALLKLDGWIKSELARYKAKAELLYVGTPMLYGNIQRISRKGTSVYDSARFLKLRDDEIFWLKNLKAEVEVGKERRQTLFQSGELDLTYRYYPFTLRKNGARVDFIRIRP